MPTFYLLQCAGVALGWYQQEAWRAARQWVKDNVECDDVRSLHLEHTVLKSRTSPVYIPAYIYRSRHLGAGRIMQQLSDMHPTMLNHDSILGLTH